MKSKNRRITANSSDASVKALVYTAAALVLALLLLYFSSQMIPRRGMMVLWEYARDYFTFQLLLSSVNIALILYLFYIYAKDYLELRSNFTVGLMLSLASMLLYALTSSPFVHAWFGGPMGMGPGLFNLIPMAFSTLALVVLAKISAE
ncbi:MAG: hypothetical protein V1787_01180 [Candidatus Micrarchaeota archaeon]